MKIVKGVDRKLHKPVKRKPLTDTYVHVVMNTLVLLMRLSNGLVVITVIAGFTVKLCVEWGSTNTTGTSMFKTSHIRCEVKT